MKRLFIAVLMTFSVTTAFAQIVNKAEYFFDTDPGPGNGTPIAISTPGVSVSFPANITINLSPGFHWLGIRVKDSDGKWSLFQRKDFYVSQPGTDLPIITTAEYFFDNDPGFGGGTPLNIQTPGFTISQLFNIPIPANMTAGTHRLAIRVKDQAGHWSLFQSDTIVVGGAAATISCPGNVTIAAPSGQCTAAVNNIDPTVAPAGSACTYVLTGATTGSGNGSASGKTFNAGVTTVTYVLTNSPNSSCSFNVTVSANVVPSVSISQSPTTICSGATVTFTASPVNGGTTPVYQWKVNDINVGSNSNTYTTSTPVNGSVVKVIMSSSLGCANPSPVTSNSITMMVNDSVQEFVNITASATTICAGTTVTFAAAESGSGSGTFQWKLNGNNVGTDSPIYRSDSLQNGDKVKVVFTPTYACSPSQVTSNEITITVNSAVTPSVSVLASANNICPGQQVTFTATPVNGGATPSYQWKLNGNNVGSNSPTYQNAALQHGDSVRVVMTSSLVAACQPTASSNSITMSVAQTLIPSVSIISSATTICTGQSVTFTATPVNGGNNPVYEWTLNNNAVGSNSSVYQTTSLANGDIIRVTMVSSQSCGSNTQAVSNAITMTVGAGVLPAVSMSASASGICAGSLVTFHASPISGAGNSPSYQWKLNGVNIPGATSSTYQSSSLADGDVIRVAMTSSLSCANPQTVLSHDSVTMSVISDPLTPSVNIEASAVNICPGQLVTFNAVPKNGGEVPGYQWKLNGINVGDNAETFSSNSLQTGDIVTVEMTSYAACTTSPTAISAPVTMTVTTVTTFYADIDGDGYGNGASGVTETCTAPAGYVSNNSDCNDDNASVHPGATEICGNSIDEDCDGQVDETCVSPDNDDDGYSLAQGDCNDNNASINPGATEICGNGIDDNCSGSVDENCTDELPVLLVKTNPAKEGDADYTILNVEVKLDRAALSPVTVNYATGNANAIAGLDYVGTNGVLTIPAGAVSASIQVRIIGDLLSEHNESFWINFSNPVNVLLVGDPRTRIMIIDDDKGKSTIAAHNAELMKEQVPLKIPTVTKRNQVWMIPQIGNYENEVLIMNVQGQVISRFINYKNQTSVGNVATGLYFYRIRITETSGQHKFYSGRLLITE